jgi:leukotriene-A4 hydrolase
MHMDAAERAKPDLEDMTPVAKVEGLTPESIARSLAPARADSESEGASRWREDAGGGGVVVHGVLSRTECEALRDELARGRETFWKPGSEHSTAMRFRNATTCEVTCEQAASELSRRLLPFLREGEDYIDIDQISPKHEQGLDGSWRADGVNAKLLFGRYPPGGHFAPHTDGSTVHSFNRRSLYSLIFYLNDCESGGETVLFQPPDNTADTSHYLFDSANRYRWPSEWEIGRARPIEGSVLAFPQELPHEGTPVGEGCEKVIIRTDIMYRRDPPVCDDEAGRAAFSKLLEAQEAEANGDASAAVSLYARANKLSPELTELCGLA